MKAEKYFCMKQALFGVYFVLGIHPLKRSPDVFSSVYHMWSHVPRPSKANLCLSLKIWKQRLPVTSNWSVLTGLKKTNHKKTHFNVSWELAICLSHIIIWGVSSCLLWHCVWSLARKPVFNTVITGHWWSPLWITVVSFVSVWTGQAQFQAQCFRQEASTTF